MKEAADSSAWQMPSTSLRSHRCAPILWLPFSLCLECALETRVRDLQKGVKSFGPCSSSTSYPVKDGEHSLDSSSGFERRVFHALLENPFVPMRSLRGVFPAATEYYKEDAVLEMLIHVASNVSAIVASPWAEMEAHKSVAAVIVVLNCHDYEPCQALTALKLVFQRYFNGCTCRCIVLDPTVEAQAAMSQHVFLPAHSYSPAEDVARYLLTEIALSIVQQVNAHIVSLSASVENVAPAKWPTTENAGTINGGGEVPTARVVNSRSAKKRGDLLLRVGALDAALLAYHDSLPEADALWCSATLESLASLRYLQRAPLLDFTTAVEGVFSSLESDATVWNEHMNTTLNQLEIIVENVRMDQRKATSLLKHSLPATSLNRRLPREVEEPLSTHIENFRRQVALIRRFFHEDNTEEVGICVEDACKNARGAFKEILHVSFVELQIYLQEALQQLRSVPGSVFGLQEREATIQLKRAELFAEEGDKRKFLESLTVLKAAAKSAPASMQQYLRWRIPYLSSLSGCRRKAIFNVVEAAVSEQQANAHGASVCLLLRACRMAGISLPRMEFQDPTAEGYFLSREKIGNSYAVDIEKGETGAMGNRAHRAQDVPPLMQLLYAVARAGLDTGMQNVVASLLLFEYYPILRREIQQKLMDILEQSNTLIEPLTLSPPPLLQSMEVLPLPPHLAPKTVPLSGAHFTFIDTGRLKMTVLTLNGKILPPGQVVWSVGTVGEVQLVLKNPLRLDVQLTSIALHCRSVETLDDLGRVSDDTVGHVFGPLAPSSYLVTGVILPSLSQRQLRLQVQPNMRGYLVVDGVEIRLGQLSLCSTFLMPSPTPTIIPVLQRLPDVSCTLGVNEVEIFGGQTIHFPLYLTNAGMVTIEKLYLTAHDESCQLESCTGCKERVSTASLYVILEYDSLPKKGNSHCLYPGDILPVKVTMVAPADNDHVVFQKVVFRTTIELPYEPPVTPENVPNAVPVFAVIPRRVQETNLRVFHVPSVAVTSLELSRDRRYVEITVKNKSKLHTIEILCSQLFFASIPDAMIVAGAEYLIPPIEITKIPTNMRRFPLPWVVRELPECRGELVLDFSILENVLVTMEPLEDVVVCIMVSADDGSGVVSSKGEWRNGPASTSQFPFKLPVMKPATILVHASAPWKRAVPLRVRLSMENHLDAEILSGPVDTTSIVGGDTKITTGVGNSGGTNGDEQNKNDGVRYYEESIEFFPFKVGEHVLNITLSDLDEREMTYTVKLQVEHL